MKRFHGKRAPVVHMSERPGQAEMGKGATRVGEGPKKHPPGNFRSHCIESFCNLFFTCSYIYILFNLGCSSDDFLLNVLVGVIAVALANERSMYKKRCCCEVGCMLLATQPQKVSHMKMRYANEMFLENSYVQIHASIQNPII